MITSQRVIIYRTDIKQDESDYEWITEYHFNNLDSVLIKGWSTFSIDSLYFTERQTTNR